MANPHRPRGTGKGTKSQWKETHGSSLEEPSVDLPTHKNSRKSRKDLEEGMYNEGPAQEYDAPPRDKNTSEERTGKPVDKEETGGTPIPTQEDIGRALHETGFSSDPPENIKEAEVRSAVYRTGSTWKTAERKPVGSEIPAPPESQEGKKKKFLGEEYLAEIGKYFEKKFFGKGNIAKILKDKGLEKPSPRIINDTMELIRGEEVVETCQYVSVELALEHYGREKLEDMTLEDNLDSIKEVQSEIEKVVLAYYETALKNCLARDPDAQTKEFIEQELEKLRPFTRHNEVVEAGPDRKEGEFHKERAGVFPEAEKETSEPEEKIKTAVGEKLEGIVAKIKEIDEGIYPSIGIKPDELKSGLDEIKGERGQIYDRCLKRFGPGGSFEKFLREPGKFKELIDYYVESAFDLSENESLRNAFNRIKRIERNEVGQDLSKERTNGVAALEMNEKNKEKLRQALKKMLEKSVRDYIQIIYEGLKLIDEIQKGKKLFYFKRELLDQKELDALDRIKDIDTKDQDLKNLLKEMSKPDEEEYQFDNFLKDQANKLLRKQDLDGWIEDQLPFEVSHHVRNILREKRKEKFGNVAEILILVNALEKKNKVLCITPYQLDFLEFTAGYLHEYQDRAEEIVKEKEESGEMDPEDMRELSISFFEDLGKVLTENGPLKEQNRKRLFRDNFPEKVVDFVIRDSQTRKE